jgi:hypothetical protein
VTWLASWHANKRGKLDYFKMDVVSVGISSLVSS